MFWADKGTLYYFKKAIEMMGFGTSVAFLKYGEVIYSN